MCARGLPTFIITPDGHLREYDPNNPPEGDPHWGPILENCHRSMMVQLSNQW